MKTKNMPSYAMFLTRSAHYAGFNVLPGLSLKPKVWLGQGRN
ncbi:MAG: hypothetical protein V7742_12820 [Halioglobus sp.]